MSDVLINNVINNQNNKLIYVYDFLHMWTFLIELLKLQKVLKELIIPI